MDEHKTIFGSLSFAGAGIAAGVLALFLAQVAGAEEAPAGQAVFTKSKCNQCHVISALKIEKLADAEEEEVAEGEEKVDPPDLSGTGKERDGAWISKYLKKEEKNQKGRKHKKKWKGSEADLKTVSEWLATLKHDVPKK